jgi:hypothetical protein
VRTRAINRKLKAVEGRSEDPGTGAFKPKLLLDDESTDTEA